MAPNLATRPTRSQVSAVVRDPLGMFLEEMDNLMSRFWSGKQDGWLSGRVPVRHSGGDTDGCEVIENLVTSVGTGKTGSVD